MSEPSNIAKEAAERFFEESWCSEETVVANPELQEMGCDTRVKRRRATLSVSKLAAIVQDTLDAAPERQALRELVKAMDAAGYHDLDEGCGCSLCKRVTSTLTAAHLVLESDHACATDVPGPLALDVAPEQGDADND